MSSDARRRPSLFVWRGALTSTELDEWLRRRQLAVPDDLRQLWITRGGGALFETETVLSPAGDPSLGEDVDTVTFHHRQRGLSQNYLVIHEGYAGLTVLDLDRQNYLTLNSSTYEADRNFETLDRWYEDLIRSEYAERYGLSTPPEST